MAALPGYARGLGRVPRARFPAAGRRRDPSGGGLRPSSSPAASGLLVVEAPPGLLRALPLVQPPADVQRVMETVGLVRADADRYAVQRGYAV